MKRRKTKTLKVKGILYSQYLIFLKNVRQVFARIHNISVRIVGGKYFGEIIVSI